MTATARPALRVKVAPALVAAALALAALSLLRPWALAFDPLAWSVWGRETTRLALDTTSGPSWKPLPVLFTTPLSLAGSATPALWLIVARAGGLLALAGTYALGARLAGRWAGAGAAAAMALSSWWWFNTALGNSEGLLAATVVWCALAHLAGRPRAAFWLLTAAALIRPETWPFVIAYGIWLRKDAPRHVIAGLVLVPLLWFGPDAIGAGGALGASKAARGIASPGSAGAAADPVLALLGDTATLFTVPVLLAALFAAAVGDRVARSLAGIAAAWVAIVAAMTAAGYAGNPRYLVAAAALACALGGAGAVRLVSATGIRLAAPLGAVLLVVAVQVVNAGALRDQSAQLSARVRSAGAFDGVIAAAGGRDALVRCSRIRTSSRARSLVAWRLDLPMRDLDAHPERPAVVIRAKWFYGGGLEPSRGPGYRTLTTAPDWQVIASCGPAPQVGLTSTP